MGDFGKWALFDFYTLPIDILAIESNLRYARHRCACLMVRITFRLGCVGTCCLAAAIHVARVAALRFPCGGLSPVDMHLPRSY
jgi:hypothetical protein